MYPEFEWLTGNIYQTRESAIVNTHAYMSCYNTQHIHTTIDNITPVEFKKNLIKCPTLFDHTIISSKSPLLGYS
ncbi:IS3 family transposase [Nitrosomonas sp.]|uniref:IS3 family transposase n=1 Tax=Nitrosomonas sp. TaxID=42353 RepID=UPI00374D0953